MGARTQDIVRKVLLPEAAPSLVSGATLTLVMLVGFSAMAGTIGGGGLGDLALRYGYQRFNTPVLLVAVVVLIGLVQLIQSGGDLLVRALRRRVETTGPPSLSVQRRGLLHSLDAAARDSFKGQARAAPGARSERAARACADATASSSPSPR
ncbi:hypothetical protein GCM10022199_08270 [Marihabitans asiaticum]